MEFRTQLFFYDDLSFEFKRRQVEASCLVEKKGEQIVRAWKDFYGTLLTFPGYRNMKPAHVSLGYSRDIILDPFNRVHEGESITQKPKSEATSIKKWIALVAENRRHLLRGKRQSNTIAEYAQIAMIILIILEGLAIGARYAFSHSVSPPEASLLTLTLLGLVGKKARGRKKTKPENVVEKTIEAKEPTTEPPVNIPAISIKSPRNWRRIWYFAGCILAALVASGIGYFYFKDTTNTFVGFGFFVAFAAFIFCGYKGFTTERYTPVVVSKTKKPDSKKPANSLNIYPHEILFEYVENPLGQPHLCRNDKKHYYVHQMNPVKGAV